LYAFERKEEKKYK